VRLAARVACESAVRSAPFDPDARRRDHAPSRRLRLARLDHASPTAPGLLERLPRLAGIDDRRWRPRARSDRARHRIAGATYYVGRAGCGAGQRFIVVADDAGSPVVTSHGASQSVRRTACTPSSTGRTRSLGHLAVPTAITDVAAEGGGWPNVRARNHALVIEMRDRFLDALGGASPLAPESSLGAMAAIRVSLPAGLEPFALEKQLLVAGWEVPIVDFATGPLVRISAQLYNQVGDADDLARELHGRGVRLA
jgi:hypothetical protein